MTSISDVEIEAVQASLERLRESYGDFTDEFYFRLFEAAPELRDMFPEDMTEQSRKLNSTLLLVISHLKNPEAVLKPVIALAKRHVDYGAAPEHYDLVRVTLFDTIVEMTPGGLSNSELEGWDKTLHTVQDLMTEHAYPKAS